MNTLDIALTWHDLGISTIPILARDKRPALSSWREYQKRLPSMGELKAWFGTTQYNIAVLTGRRLAVIDFDSNWELGLWLASLPPSLASLILSTYRVSTHRGMHWYFYVEEETTNWRGDGVDVKGNSGYVLAPNSIHPSGSPYRPIGQPSQIQRIGSLSELLPMMNDERPVVKAHQSRVVTDPFDDAMRRHGSGTSVEEIKARWSFADLLSLDGRGQRHVTMVNCPFHDDTHASLAIYPNGHAFCHGCQWRGDVIDMYALLHKMTLQEAIRKMAH